MAKKKKVNKKKSFSKVLLPWIVVAIMFYTVAAFILQFFTSTEISSTLTTCYFIFWTTEILAIAGIKTVKIKGDKQEVKETISQDTEENVDEEDI